MATEPKEQAPTPTPAPDPSLTLSTLGKIIGDAVAEGISRTTRKKVTFAEYDPRSSYQPDRTKTIPLRRQCWQIGTLLKEETLFNEEISLLNRITHSGRYIDRLVEVIVSNEGGEEVVHINWNCKSPDQRNLLKDKARSFTEILQQIVGAQEEEDAEVAEAKASRVRRRA